MSEARHDVGKGAPDLSDEIRRRRMSLRDGYIPPTELRVDPSVLFYDDAVVDLDPVDFEVIRLKLWNLNIDHCDAVCRVSGSTVIAEAHDFNTAITTARGDVVTLSPQAIFFGGYADAVIKWTLEHRSGNVGIRPGDIFIQNDPWVGTNHQMDVALYEPVFVDDKVFCWLFNCIHQREVGGLIPGGFNPGATDVYAEPAVFPPMKLADAGVVREDIVDAWTRKSRLPELSALELSSQIAGLKVARERMEGLLVRYGPQAIKATMTKMLDDTARVVGERLASLPDGEWRDVKYQAGCVPGDDRLHRVALCYTKIGDRVTVSNGGTDRAIGAINVSPGLFRAAVLNALTMVLAYDQYLCVGGVLRQVDVRPEPGTISAATHPSAVASSLGQVALINQAHVLASKMVSGHVELGRHGFASSALHTLSINNPSWVDDNGYAVGDLILDMLAGGTGAFSHQDGFDYAGNVATSDSYFGNVERFEQVLPLLYLYRRELPHSGGHGRFRGGVCYACAWVGHKSQTASMSSAGWAKSVTQGPGVCGGFPATGGYFWHATDTGIQRWLAAGRMPGSPAELRELAPEGSFAPARLYNRLSPVDVMEMLANPGGGWGDPLARPPALVARDRAEGRVDPVTMHTLYGVVLDDHQGVDPEATDRRRAEVRDERRARSRPARRPIEGRLGDGEREALVEGVARDGHGNVGCAWCGALLCEAGEGYRSGCRELEVDLGDLGEVFLSPRAEIGRSVVARSYACPSCLTILDTQVCLPEDEPFDDARFLMGDELEKRRGAITVGADG